MRHQDPLNQSEDYKTLYESSQAEIEGLKRQLETTQRNYVNLFENAGDSIFIIDLETYDVIDANKNASRRLNYKHGELLGMPLNDLEIPDKDKAVEWESEWSGTWVYECFYKNKAGELIPVEVSSRLIRWQERDAVLKFVRNIEIRNLLKKREFELALEKERIDLLALFVQNVGHEFRTPLATISTGSYLMSRMDKVEKRQQKNETVQEQVKRIQMLVDSLLLMVELENQPQTPAPDVDLVTIITIARDTFRSKYGEQPLLTCEIGLDLPPVIGNVKYYKIMLNQLLENAYRFTPMEGTIHLAAHYQASQVIIQIRDSGRGIDAASLERVFESFWRYDEAHSTPGFGLGLPIAEKIVTQYGGEIRIESQEGQGTCVYVSLPVSQNA